jgi:signal transduction histidine kinase
MADTIAPAALHVVARSGDLGWPAGRSPRPARRPRDDAPSSLRATTGGVPTVYRRVVHRLRDPRLLDCVIAVALAAALQLHLAVRDEGAVALVDAVGGLFLTLPLAARRRAPVAVAAVFGATAILNAAFDGGLFEGEPPPFASLLAGALAFYSVGAYCEDRRALAGAGLGVASLWTAVLAGGEIDVQSFLFSGGLVVVAPWLAGRTSRARVLRVAALESEQRQRELNAVAEERSRIARELHDVIAHNVGLMVVQAQGAQRVLDRDPERAREALETIERAGRAALGDMRRSLGALRKPDSDAPLAPQPGIESLGALIEQARRSGLEVELVTEGDPTPLAAGVDLSVYRIVQEALTNTLKHAGPAHARVEVCYAGDELELEISDDGAPGQPRRSPGVTEGGHGLVGMRERVALYGGQLHADHRPEGGFVVRVSLPLVS